MVYFSVLFNWVIISFFKNLFMIVTERERERKEREKKDREREAET